VAGRSEQARSNNRARLLEAAAVAFARHGLYRANINEISLAAGLAKGTVYNYFPSKEALFLAVVEEGCAWAAAADGVGAEVPTRERLRAAMAADLAWAIQHEPFARVLVRELFAGDDAFYRRMVAAGAPFTEHVGQILRDGVVHGEVRGDLPVQQLAEIFAGLGVLGLVHHWGSGGTWLGLDELPGYLVDLFLEGARPRPARLGDGSIPGAGRPPQVRSRR
jgi:AcrR family transcriptional regulator